jgi:hypothetical protein
MPLTFMHAALTRTYGHQQIPLDVLDCVYGAIAPYTLDAAWMTARAAYRTDVALYLKTVRYIADHMNPDDYYYVATFLADKARPDEARLAYERYAQVATDQVTLSNTLWPLALNYLELGRVADALAVGRHAHKAAFLTRHPELDLRHERDSLVTDVFPGGLNPVDDKRQAAPSRGLRIATAGFSGVREGLRDGDIIVGIDGVAIGNMPQYNLQKFRKVS